MHPKNGPLETVEELLLVRGVTPQLLFGADINRNGQLDRARDRDDDTTSNRTRRSDGISRLVGLSHALQPGVERQPRRRAADLSEQQRSATSCLTSSSRQSSRPSGSTFIIAYRQAGRTREPRPGRRRRAARRSTWTCRPRRRSARCSTWSVRKVQSHVPRGRDNRRSLASPFGAGLGEMARLHADADGQRHGQSGRRRFPAASTSTRPRRRSCSAFPA